MRLNEESRKKRNDEMAAWQQQQQLIVKPRRSRDRRHDRDYYNYTVELEYDSIDTLPQYLQDEIYDMESEDTHNRDGIYGNWNGEHTIIKVDDWNGARDIAIRWRVLMK